MSKYVWLAALAVALGAPPMGAAEPKTEASPSCASLAALPASAWNEAHARHLLFVAGFGGDQAEVQRLHKLGLARAVNALVDYGCQPAFTLPDPAACQPPEKEPNLAKLSPEERQRVN